MGEGCLRENGAVASGFAITWAAELDGLNLSSTELRGLSDLVLDPPANLVDRIPAASKSWAEPWLTGSSDHPYWSSIPEPHPGSVQAATLNIGGWYDTFRRATFAQYGAMAASPRRDATTRLVVGPWSHVPLHPPSLENMFYPSSTGWSIDDLQIDFFNAELREGSSRFEPVMVAVMNSDDAWTGETWPPPGVTPMRMWLDSSGRANARDGDGQLTDSARANSSPDHLVYDHGAPVPSVGGDDCGDPTIQGMGMAEQSPVETRKDVLIYTSHKIFDDDIILAGPATIEFTSLTWAHQVQWFARLCLVTDQGSFNVVEGVVRRSVDFGEPTPMRIDFGDFAVRLGAGDRLRVQLTNGSSPRWQGVGLGTAEQISRSIIFHDEASPACLTFNRIA